MIYDAVLATRGWGVEDFRRATPEFLAACRWLVMVQRAMPVYDGMVELRDADTTPENLKAKLALGPELDEWKPWLFPEDGDG